eukprot:820784_1
MLHVKYHLMIIGNVAIHEVEAEVEAEINMRSKKMWVSLQGKILMDDDVIVNQSIEEEKKIMIITKMMGGEEVENIVDEDVDLGQGLVTGQEEVQVDIIVMTETEGMKIRGTIESPLLDVVEAT